MSRGLGAVERWLLEELPEAPETVSVLELAARRAGADPAPRGTLESVRRAAKTLDRKGLVELRYGHERRPAKDYPGGPFRVPGRPGLWRRTFVPGADPPQQGVSILRVGRPWTPEQRAALSGRAGWIHLLGPNARQYYEAIWSRLS